MQNETAKHISYNAEEDRMLYIEWSSRGSIVQINYTCGCESNEQLLYNNVDLRNFVLGYLSALNIFDLLNDVDEDRMFELVHRAIDAYRKQAAQRLYEKC